MLELLVLVAIAYAGARGVESITHTGDRRLDTKAAETTVKTVAGSGPKNGGGTNTNTTKPGPAGPAEPGGTFSAAAPRSAKLGGKAAVPLAVLTETSTVIWKAVGEGYRERWPEIRQEHRQKMAERAAKRKAEKEEAAAQAQAAEAEAEEKRKAQEAAAAAGPPPPFPPPPWGAATEKRHDERELEDTRPRKDGLIDPFDPAHAPAAATVPDPRAGEAPSWPGDDTTPLPDPHTTPAPDPVSEPAGGRHLTVVPDTAQIGESMSAPHAIIPEIRTLDGLMNAFTLVRAMCEMRAEEAMAIAADDLALSTRLDQIEAEMAEMEVDDKTRREVDLLRESIHAQSRAAAQYGGRAKDSGDFATAAAQAAYKSHGGIAEAVQSSPIESAAQAGYYDR
ncbi:hypothetical protein [Streptomyces vinaceus]|uniref:hypothetical protein n=1 Tax=Streptomyces vinaceus TaxID=1960 RepID=UPI0005BE8F4E|nr:hypothetical protein [Streptomyces vinaceus]